MAGKGAVDGPVTAQQQHSESQLGKKSNIANTVKSSGTTSPETLEYSPEQDTNLSAWSRCMSVLLWMPPWCRWDPAKPPVFSMSMNVLFGFAGAFTVANLYYSHPILDILARDFDVSYETASNVPTFAQAGYCAGLLSLCPLGDLLRRRTFVLSLVLFTATLWIGLCTTRSFAAFEAIQFVTGWTTVTPQIMLPLVGDLAPPHRRATALSIVSAGNVLGIVIARVLSGVVTQYTNWRNIYWVALGLQYGIFSLLWLFMPDYPPTNPAGLNYFKLLWSILAMIRKHSVLVQSSLIGFLVSATFTSFWTTLTFLLVGPPYFWTTLDIGLFALISIAGMLMIPVFARTVIDRFVPLFSVLLGLGMGLVGIVVGTYSGKYSAAGPAFQAWLLDMSLQTTAIANRSAIYAVEPTGRNRVNTVFMVMTFLGQLTGTAAGNHVYAHGGWVASGSLSVGFVGLGFVVAIARGPWERGRIGWHGGWSIRKKDPLSADGFSAEGREDKTHVEVERSLDEESTGDLQNDDKKGAEMKNTEKALEDLAGEDGKNIVREANKQATLTDDERCHR